MIFMKHNKKFNKLIAIVGVFALLLGTAIPTAGWLANKTVGATNAVERDSRASGARLAYTIPISFKGNSVSEDVSGLAFAYTITAKGIAVKNGNEIDYTNATISVEGKTYKLLEMGVVSHNKESGKAYEIQYCNGSSIVQIPAKYLFNLNSFGEATFAVRIIQIPEKGKNTHITVLPYVKIQADGVQKTYYFYDYIKTRTFNEAANGREPHCSCFDWSVRENYLTVYHLNEETGSFNIYGPTKIQDTVGVMWRVYGASVDIATNHAIVIQVKCTFDEKVTHAVTIPKECRYDHV